MGCHFIDATFAIAAPTVSALRLRAVLEIMARLLAVVANRRKTRSTIDDLVIGCHMLEQRDDIFIGVCVTVDFVDQVPIRVQTEYPFSSS
jgi:hypothetical protein